LPLVCTREGHWKSGVIMLGDATASKLVPVVLVGNEALSNTTLGSMSSHRV